MSNKLDNPFYRNPIFTEADTERLKIKMDWLSKLFLMFRTTYVQTNDGYAFFYKRSSDGRIWLIKTEKFGETW